MDPVEMALRQKAVAAFVEAEEQSVVLMRPSVASVAGGTRKGVLTNQPSQKARLIRPNRQKVDTTVTANGSVQPLDMTLVSSDLAFNVEVGDELHLSGSRYVVRFIHPNPKDSFVVDLSYEGEVV